MTLLEADVHRYPNRSQPAGLDSGEFRTPPFIHNFDSSIHYMSVPEAAGRIASVHALRFRPEDEAYVGVVPAGDEVSYDDQIAGLMAKNSAAYKKPRDSEPIEVDNTLPGAPNTVFEGYRWANLARRMGESIPESDIHKARNTDMSMEAEIRRKKAAVREAAEHFRAASSERRRKETTRIEKHAA